MPADTTPHGSEPATRIVVLIFSDIVGSTALPAKFGAAPYAAALRLHNELFERLAAEESVTIVKFTGDGYFASCPSAASAVRFALRFQQSMRDMAWAGVVLTTRLGIHLGEVSDITAAGRTDMIGSAANLASRLMSVGLGGQILLSRAPFDEGRLHVSAHPPCGDAPAPALEWLAHGPYRFNGYDEPIEVFEVGAKGAAPLVPPPDAEKAKRALRPGDEETLGWRPAEGLEIPGRPGWRIAEKLGAGGFGEVWAGQHAKTRERRAYKFCFDAERLRALKREVTLTRLLRETLGDREDIVRIFDLRLDAPPYFLESELATDGNLLQWAERQGGLGAIPLAERLELVAATAAALAAAHSVGVLHKDIKPTNVLIFTGKDGRSRPRLVDFGIGTLADSGVLAQHGITGAGFTGATLKHSSGTPTYSAPEYLAGKPFTVQGDVYSLGVMLWQLVTAKPDQPLAEGWQRDVSDPLLREDIALCVDGDPARRLPSAAELATRLRALPERTAETVRHAEAEAADTARRERQRRLRFATAIATAIAAIAIPLAVWAVVKQREAEEEKANAVAQTVIAEREKTNAQEQARLAKLAEEKADTERDKAKAQVREASRSDTATAQARLADGKWQEAVAYLGRAIRYDPENRNAQQALWLALRHGERDVSRLPLQVFPHAGTPMRTIFSPDGTRAVTFDSDYTARIWDTMAGLPIGQPFRHDGSLNSATFSSDGTRIVTVEHKTAHIWDAKTGLPIGQPFEHDLLVRTAILSSDGTHILTATQDEKGSLFIPSLPGSEGDDDDDKFFVRIWDAKTGVQIGSPLNRTIGVHTAIFSPDGTRVVTASFEKTARIWDAKTGIPIGQPLRHDGVVHSAIFSPDGSRVVTASKDQTARIWDAKTGMPIGPPLRHEGAVTSDTVSRVAAGNDSVLRAVFSPDGSRVVTASKDQTARIWDAKTGMPIGPPLRHEVAGDTVASVLSAIFSPDGSRIVTAGNDRTARIWDANTGLQIGQPFKHDNAVYGTIFSPDGTRVLTKTYDTVHIWDVITGFQIGQPLKPEGSVTSVNFNPDGSLILTGSKDKTARIWDATTGIPIGPPLRHDGVVRNAIFSPDGARILSETSEHTMHIWDAMTRILIGPPLNHRGLVSSTTFSPDGFRVLTAGASDHTARIWDVKTGMQTCPPLKHEGLAQSAVFSPDGNRVATVVNKTARIWDAKTGTPIGVPLTHEDTVNSAIFSLDGSRILTASEDKTARIWNAKTGLPVGPLLKHEYPVRSATFNPDGTLVFTAHGDGWPVSIWDAKTGVEIHFDPPIYLDGLINNGAFSSDGTRIVTASMIDTAQIWNAKTGIQIGPPLKHEGSVTSATFSPDGTRIVTSSGGNTARIWDAMTGLPIGLPLSRGSRISNSTFSPDGTRILTASYGPDGSSLGTGTDSDMQSDASIWDAKSGVPIGPPLKQGRFLLSPTFSPDGSLIVTGGDDNTARIWDVKPGIPLNADLAEMFTAFCCGARLDPELGSLRQLTHAERMQLWTKLEPALAGATDWLFTAMQTFPQDPQTALVSPRMTLTLREASTRLLGSYRGSEQAAACDPTHPLLPFAKAEIEASNRQPANPIRVAWLCDYGMKHLPADTTAADLRLAASFVAEVAETVPEQKATALLLLDRAAKLAPEDEDTKALRERLK